MATRSCRVVSAAAVALAAASAAELEVARPKIYLLDTLPREFNYGPWLIAAIAAMLCH